MNHALIAEYHRHGWSLIPIPPGTKGPRNSGWNTKVGALRTDAILPEGYGVGLGHAYSGTMALDIDDWALAYKYGLDVEELYEAQDAVHIESGRENRAKLLYAMPQGIVLPSRAVKVDRRLAFELRCGTADGLTVQDVLPPSVHPLTNLPYSWGGRGDWKKLPIIPQPVLDIWNNLLTKDQFTVAVDGVDASWDEIQEAIGHISADCSYDDWITVGMALNWAANKTFQPDQGLAVWHNWSKQSLKKYAGEAAIVKHWNSFKQDRNDPITVGSLYHIARESGWVRKMPDASTLFNAVKQPRPPEVILKDLRPAPPDIDLSLWPKVLTTRVKEVSEGVGCDPLVPLFAGLGAVCGVIDAQMRLELMPGWEVPPVLFLMTIGDPSDKKSPGSRPMLGPLRAIEKEDQVRYAKARQDWELKEAVYAVAKKAALNFMTSPDAILGAEGPMLPEEPKMPAPLTIVVEDITSQKLVRYTAENPRGVLCYLDEMASWAAKLTDKTSGEDKSVWTKAYDSEFHKMDRVVAGSIHADNHAVSIYGNIQPRVLHDCFDALSKDGLAQRFIPAVLRPEMTKLGHPLPEFMTTATQWENTLRFIYSLPPNKYKLSEEAYSHFREFQRWYEMRKQAERMVNDDKTFMTAFGKLEGLTGRLVLLFHVLENPFNPTVAPEIVDRVVQIVKGYVVPALRHMHHEVGGVSSLEAYLTDYLLQYADKVSITMRDIRRSARKTLEKVSEREAYCKIPIAMLLFEQEGWCKRVDDGKYEHRGVAEWIMNPEVLKQFGAYRKQVIAARQAVLDDNYGLVSKTIQKKRGLEPDVLAPTPKVHGAEIIFSSREAC